VRAEEKVLDGVDPGARLVVDPAKWFVSPPLDDKAPGYVLGWNGALRMVVEMAETGLTDDEMDLVFRLGELAEDFERLMGDGPTAEADMAEVIRHVHALQQTVMAQAAARTHPTKFRLLGGSTRTGDDHDDD
jgi:hypothetical protein